MKSEQREKLTRQQALEQGYSKCAIFPYSEWNTLFTISDLTDVDFEDTKWVLAEKQAKQFCLSEGFIKESVLDEIQMQEDEVGCDTNMGFDTLKDFDFKTIEDAINEKLSGHEYYTLTETEI